MSVKSKFGASLLAATALFVIAPKGSLSFGAQGSDVSAEELPKLASMSLDKPATGASNADLNALLGDDAAGSGRDYSALAPQASADAAVTVQQTTFVPGQNPFSTPAATNDVNGAAVAPSAGQGQGKTASVPAAIGGAAKATASANPATSDKVDDSALRYYAAQKDLKRLGAEMRRLKTLYPSWEPPKDLFAPAMNVSEQPLWDIYKTGNYAAVRAKIAQIQSLNPRWQPSADIMMKLQIGEARSLINRAYSARRWNEVVQTAQANPDMLVCSDMQVLWNVGEAFAEMKNYAKSFDVYKYILSNCQGEDLRLSTVQKASLVLPSQGTQSLIALGQVMPDGSGEFDNIGFDGLRRQIGEFTQHGDFTSAPSDEELKRFVDFVERKQSGPDAELIGWFFFAQEDWELSNSWFIQAAKYDRTPKAIEGIVLTLRKMERTEDAYKLARRYMKAGDGIRKQYVELVSEQLTSETPTLKLSDDEMKKFAAIVTDDKSPLGGQALGWKLLADGKTSDAAQWFAQSVKWTPTEGGVIGLAVLAARDKNYGALQSIKEKYGKEFSGLEDFRVYKPSHSKKSKRVVSNVKKIEPKKKKLFLFQSDT